MQGDVCRCLRADATIVDLSLSADDSKTDVHRNATIADFSYVYNSRNQLHIKEFQL